MNRTLFLLLISFATNGLWGGEPWRRHVVDNGSRGADGVRLKDTNGDGLLDIATGWEEGGQVRVYLNPGPRKTRQSWPAVTVGRVGSPEDAVLVDLDADGASDVVSCCEGNNRTVYVHWAPGPPADYRDSSRWLTTAIPVTQRRQSWMFAVPLDVDGRNGIDLIVGSKGKQAAVGWLQSPKDPRQVDQWRYRRLSDAGWIMSLAPHDMDGDGDHDVLVSDRKGPDRGVYWLENPGTDQIRTGVKWSRRNIGGRDREVMFLTRDTLSRAGKADVLAAVRGAGISVFSLGNGTTWDTFEIPLPPNCGTGKAVALGDMDLDGHNDIVFSCENAIGDRSGVRWLSATAEKTWTDHEISGRTGVKFDRLELLDLDGDGDLDVLTCEERSNLGVIWYENPKRR